MPPRLRTEPCEVLRRDGVPSVLWLEDAIANYNVPTIVFDLFLLVPNHEKAAEILRRAGWVDVDTADATCCLLFAATTISHRCLKPPGIIETQEIPEGSSPAPPRGPPPPTTTVLLSARDCNVSIQQISSGPLLAGNFVPPLPFLVDGLISGILDAPAESLLETRLSLQLVYLYAHCKLIQFAHFASLLRFENRQFHIDALTGPSVGKSKLIAWNRQVRRELSEGKRQLMDKNSLLSANPSEYQIIIRAFRSEFRELPKTS